VVVAGVIGYVTTRTPPQPTSVVVKAPPRTLAVLPFANLSGDESQEYFSDGLTEELINRVGKIPDLRVTARTSAFSFKGKPADVRTIAQALDVGAVLEGSVRRSGDRIRVTAQLINAEDGYNLWSDSYERSAEDVFSIHDEIANRIAQVVGIQLAPGVTRKPTTDPVAYDYYLRGRIAFAQRANAAHIRQAIDLYEQALALDPTFAHAKAGLATAVNLLPFYGGDNDPETRARAAALAREALAIDDTISDAHGVLGGYYTEVEHDWMAAAAEFQAARRWGPNNVNVHLWYGDFLCQMGRFADALAELLQAHRLDPASAAAAAQLAMAYTLANDPDNMERYAALAKELGRDDNDGIFVDAAILRGDFDLAFTRLQTVEGHSIFYDQLVRLLREPKYRSEVTRLWMQQCADGRKPRPCYFGLAYLEQYAAAFALARRGFQESKWYPQDLWDPMLAPSWQQPGFKDLVRDIGLVDYWRKYGWPDVCQPEGDDFRCK
jgi:TolB-like protein/cytochrome c-type biogenesis protein CcmH/NrfG